MREAEEAKLRRERRVLEQQAKALLKLPNKKERSAMEGELHGCLAGRRGHEQERAQQGTHDLHGSADSRIVDNNPVPHSPIELPS